VVIHDPDNPNQALDSEGHINYAVRLYPVGTRPDFVPSDTEHIVGWALPWCLSCQRQHPQEERCAPRT